MAHLVKPPVALGYSFDGVDDWVKFTFPDDVATKLQQELTIEALVYFPVFNPDKRGRVFDRGYRPHAWVERNKMIFTTIALEDGTPHSATWTPPVTLDVGMWLHLIYMYKAKSFVKFAYNANISPDISFPYTIETPVVGGNIAVFWGYYTTGLFVLFSMYSRVLTSEEVNDLFNIRRNIMKDCVLKFGIVGLVRGGGTKWLDEGPYKLHGTVYGAKRVRCCHCNPVVNYGV